MFDEETEKLAKQAGMRGLVPEGQAAQNRLDNKIETVRIGNKAGVPSVPNNVLGSRKLRTTCRRSVQEGRIGR